MFFKGHSCRVLAAVSVRRAGGVSSFVPFFSFIIIVAVGVDYSIFLMMRYKEYGELAVGEVPVKASQTVGGIIISAMVISRFIHPIPRLIPTLEIGFLLRNGLHSSSIDCLYQDY